MISKPNILLLYTGGTIGMMRSSQTGSLKPFNFDKLLRKIPEIKLLDCEVETISLDPPIDSSNMCPEHWIAIAELIESNYEKFDGFVVLHGSDTMSYSSSALSFMFENLGKPIVFTGSQLPIGDLRTDAKENLITAIQIAALQKNGEAVIQEVCLYFEYKLYRANRTTKINAEQFQAFASLNYPALAESGVHLKVFEENLWKQNKNNRLKIHKELDTRVGLLKLFPGIRPDFIEHFLSAPHLKGLILETFGSGNAPSGSWFIDILKRHIEQGLIIVNVTQCSGGSVAMGQYETSEQLKQIGMVSGKDITTESALAKMMFLLPKYKEAKDFKINFERPICGDIS